MAARRRTPEPARHDRFARIEEALSAEIGDRLRQAREERQLSQQEVGEALGYTAAMISAFEKGRRRMKVEDLTRACIALGKQPEYFLQTGRLREGAPAIGGARIGMALRAEVANLPGRT